MPFSLVNALLREIRFSRRNNFQKRDDETLTIYPLLLSSFLLLPGHGDLKKRGEGGKHLRCFTGGTGWTRVAELGRDERQQGIWR